MEKNYDVFISYAHADAKTPERKKVIETIKARIEEALATASSDSCVFLDSEALKWGDEWESRIRRSIVKCKVFVYLLSPNYLCSDYCQRERLWWANEEINKGYLNQGTRPIYYIDLKAVKDPRVDQYKRESRLLQAEGDRPFFSSLDEIKLSIVEQRVRKVADEIGKFVIPKKVGKRKGRTGKNRKTDRKQPFNFIHPSISRYFVGRLEELMDINAKIMENGKIPVISAEAGVGKTELAVAYTCAYSESFPEGRFMIPMQGVHDWAEAMSKMVEWCICCNVSPEKLGLPEDFNKLPPEDKKNAAYKMLLRYAENGAVLLLLDNLEDMSLISNTGLRGLTGVAGLPNNLRIVATTRLNEEAPSSFDAKTKIELKNLKEKDALELFFKMGNNIFPFAKYPIADGKLLLDLVPKNKHPTKEEVEKIEQDYDALKKIIHLLDGHAWSMEIIAGRIATSIIECGECNILDELELLQKTPLNQLTGTGLHRSMAYNPKDLLQQTFDLILNHDNLVKGEKMGQRMMRLCECASFFKPEQISESILKGLWDQIFGSKKITFEKNGASLTKNAFDYAITQMKKYRIVNGDGPMLNMHRLTRSVLQDRLNDSEKLQVVKTMRLYLSSFLENTWDPSPQQLFPWCGWALEWVNELHALRKDRDFQSVLFNLAFVCMDLNMYEEAKKIVMCETLKVTDKRLKTQQLLVLGRFYMDTNELCKAEERLKKALVICRELSEKNPEKYRLDLANALNRFAILHLETNHLEEADEELSEALGHYRELADKNPKKPLKDLADVLNNLALLHDNLDRKKVAEKEHSEALTIRRELADENPKRHLETVAISLNNLALLHKSCDRIKEAESECFEALTIRRELADENPEKYRGYLATSLNNIADLHIRLNRIQEAESEYSEALTIDRELADKNPDKFRGYLASTLNNIAALHCDLQRYQEAESEYSEALTIYRELADKNPERFRGYLASTLNNIATLHCHIRRYEEAEREYTEGADIFRKLADNVPEMYLELLASCLKSLSNLHDLLNRHEDMDADFGEIRTIYQKLADMNPEYREPLASFLNMLSKRHFASSRFEEAEAEGFDAMDIYCELAVAEKKQEQLESMAEIMERIANIHFAASRFEEAEDECSNALTIYRTLAGVKPEEHLGNLIKILQEIILLHNILRRSKEEMDELSELLGILREIVHREPKYLEAMANALSRISFLHFGLARHEESEKESRELLDIQHKLAKKEPDKYLELEAGTLNNLAFAHSVFLNQSREAEAEFSKALKIYRKLAKENPKHIISIADTLSRLADLHFFSLGNYKKAKKEYEEVLSIYKGLEKEERRKYLKPEAKTWHNLAVLNVILNQPKDAESAYFDAMSFYRALSDYEPEKYLKKMAGLFHALSKLFRKAGQTERADEAYSDAITLYRMVANAKH